MIRKEEKMMFDIKKMEDEMNVPEINFPEVKPETFTFNFTREDLSLYAPENEKDQAEIDLALAEISKEASRLLTEVVADNGNWGDGTEERVDSVLEGIMPLLRTHRKTGASDTASREALAECLVDALCG